MTGFYVTLKRELASSWFTPLAWILLVLLVMLQGVTFSSILATFAEGAESAPDGGPLEAFFGHGALIPLVYSFVCPALTMRSFAEERRTGTIENLLSAPVSVSGIVAGKYTAAVISFSLLWCPSIAYPLMLDQVMRIDWRVVGTSYLGVLGLGAGFIALGMLLSTLSRSQFAALALTAGIILLLGLVGLTERVHSDGLLHNLCDHLAIQAQLKEMSQGNISLRRLVYDVTLIVLPLFVTTRIVSSWRWS